MKLFLVSPYDDDREKVESALNKHFQEHYIPLEARRSPLWIVAAPAEMTPAKICDQLGIGGESESEGSSGIVIQIGDYNGFDSKTLWQQMEAWLNESP